MKRNFLILAAFFSLFLLVSATRAQTSTGSQNSSAPGYNVGDLIEAADYRGAWYKSKITGEDNGKYHIHFFGFDAAWDEWVTPERVRPSDDLDFGREVDVEQKGVWYKAFLVDSRYGTEHLVAYVDYDEEEWVKDDRIRESAAGWQGTRQGRIIEVADGKSWRRATILKRRAGEIYIHYEGYDDIWNEWVREDKIRRIK